MADKKLFQRSNTTFSAATDSLLSSTLDIKIRSVESTLLPLVRQISALIKLQEATSSAKHQHQIRQTKFDSPLDEITKSVHEAIKRFISVGLSLTSDKKPSLLKSDMEQACEEARLAGDLLLGFTVSTDSFLCTDKLTKKELTDACRNLLSAVTRVLLLADLLMVSEIVTAIDKVSQSLDKLYHVRTYSEFATKFAQYGTDMVAVAHFTGDRQADLKDDMKKAQLSSARTVLEKFTLLVLLSTKCHIRKQRLSNRCTDSNVVRDIVFQEVHRNLRRTRRIVVDSGAQLTSSQSNICVDMKKSDDILNATYFTCSKRIEAFIDSHLATSDKQCMAAPDLAAAVKVICDRSGLFGEASFVSHEQRDRITTYIYQLKLITDQFLECSGGNREKMTSVNFQNLKSVIQQLSTQLENLVLHQAIQIFRMSDEVSTLGEMREYGMLGRKDMMELSLRKFEEQNETVCELCRLMVQISPCVPLTVACEHHGSMFRCLYELICESARQLVTEAAELINPSAGAGECYLDLYDNLSRYWIAEMNEFGVLIKELQDVVESQQGMFAYFSLPRPGRHGTTGRNVHLTQSIKSSSAIDRSYTASALSRCALQLEPSEKARITLLGMEMKIATNEVDCEAERWDEAHHNEIIKRAKNMSNMAFSMYQFTRNEGSIHCAQDLFVQAGFLVEEGVRLHDAMERFITDIPSEKQKRMVEQQLDILPVLCHQLQLRIRVLRLAGGRRALLDMIDQVIQETRDIMNCVARLVNISFFCYNKYNMNASCIDDATQTGVRPYFRLQSPQFTNHVMHQQNMEKQRTDRPYDSNDESSSSCSNVIDTNIRNKHTLNKNYGNKRVQSMMAEAGQSQYPTCYYKTDRV
ncbi:hypothetical protein ACOME3_007855 [Neoechinorhynchus agilis]